MRTQILARLFRKTSEGTHVSFQEWWWCKGEPLVLTALALIAITLPLLVLVGLLSPAACVRAVILLVWATGVVGVTHLPRLLRNERRRLPVVSLTVVGVLAIGVLAHPLSSILAQTVQQDNPPAEASSAQTSELSFKSPPRISRAVFAGLLNQGIGGTGTSPAAPYADDIYDIIVGYELDPAVALAFFAQESQYCTTGMCRSYDMKSWGGQRAAYNPQRSAGIVRGLYGPFVSFHTWQDSISDWCELILNRYVARGLDTVEKAIPVYAPASDGNVPAIYIDNVRRRVALWSGQEPGPAFASGERRYNDLETGLLLETFLATGYEHNHEWAFHKFALEEARAGRPIGSPLDDSRIIVVDGQRYAIQTFALDTLYTPLADIESETNWNDVRRMSELLEAQLSSAPDQTAQPEQTPAPELQQESSSTVDN